MIFGGFKSCDLVWAWRTLLRCHAHFRSSHVTIMQTLKNANNYLSMQRRRLPDGFWLDHVIRIECGLIYLAATPFLEDHVLYYKQT